MGNICTTFKVGIDGYIYNTSGEGYTYFFKVGYTLKIQTTRLTSHSWVQDNGTTKEMFGFLLEITKTLVKMELIEDGTLMVVY